jgi:hypothetical protein
MTLLIPTLAAVSCALIAGLLAWGGVWGVVWGFRLKQRANEQQLLDLVLRMEAIEYRLQRESGRKGKELAIEKRTREQELVEEIARKASMSVPHRPTSPRLLVDEDGLVHAPPDVIARAKAEAGK